MLEKYVEHPYMKKFLDNKVSKSLAEMVALIDNGEADLLTEKNTKQGVKIRETRYAATLNPEPIENVSERTRKQTKEPKVVESKKSKKDKKKKKKRKRSSSSSGGCGKKRKCKWDFKKEGKRDAE